MHPVVFPLPFVSLFTPAVNDYITRLFLITLCAVNDRYRLAPISLPRKNPIAKFEFLDDFSLHRFRYLFSGLLGIHPAKFSRIDKQSFPQIHPLDFFKSLPKYQVERAAGHKFPEFIFKEP